MSAALDLVALNEKADLVRTSQLSVVTLEGDVFLALLDRVEAAEKDAARYRAWRDTMLGQDSTPFTDAMQTTFPDEVNEQDRMPNAAEWGADVAGPTAGDLRAP